MDSLGIDGAWVFTPKIHRDVRGSFHESFRGDEVAAALGYPFNLAQANWSVSQRGVIRGVHFADVPPGQAKYVSCVRGAIIHVVVDLRVGSPGLGHTEAVRLDDENRRSVFIAEGLGHAFMALTDECTVVYLCSTPYMPGREHGVNPLDPPWGSTGPATSSLSCHPRMSLRRRWPRPSATGCCPGTPTALPTPPACATAAWR